VTMNYSNPVPGGCCWNSTRFLAVAILSVVALFSIQPAYSQASDRELWAVRIHEVADMLSAKPSGFARPCSDRAAWELYAHSLQGFVAQAEQILGVPLPAFDEQAYLQFSRSGDRKAMEQNLHSRMDQLIPLVLAECAEYRGRFVPRIAEVMDSLAAMPSWTLSAHDPRLLNLYGVSYSVDLNAADMADNLAEALYLLGTKIPEATHKHVMAEMQEHVFGPMRKSFEQGNRAENHSGNWWLYADMNWNAVCLKGVTGAALAVLPDVEDRALFVAAAEHYIQHYEDGFNSDGYDTEGLGYWNYGFSHFIELRGNLLWATGGKIDLLASSKMQKAALFGIEFPMMPGNAAAFGDAGTAPIPDAHLIGTIDRIFQIRPGREALDGQDIGVQHVDLPALLLSLFPVRDELPTPSELRRQDLQIYYADSGVLVSRPAPGQHLAVTVKAGGNTTHSHNDIGSFVIGLDDVQPVGDPGGPKYYTKATFGPARLDSRLLNSFGHPVPEIDGCLQLDATTVHVNVLSHFLSNTQDSIKIDMSNAYDAPALKHLTRTVMHSRADDGLVEITDEVELASPAEIIESLPTHGTWQKVNDDTLLFQLGGQQLRAVIEAPVPITFTEAKVDDYGNPFTRVEVRIPLIRSGTISMLFTPVN
jgi:hypothetical protein